MALNVIADRVVAEVLYAADSVPEDIAVKTTRAVAEVIGTAADYLGIRAKTTRVLAELIGSATAKHPGFDLPGIQTAGITVAACILPESSVAPGYLALQDANGNGLSWEWSSPGGPVTQRYRVPGLPDDVDTVTGSPFVTVFSSPNGNITLTDLAVLRPAGTLGGATIKELIVFDHQVSPELQAHLEAYLLCRWLSTGCTSPRSPCA